MKIIEVLNSGNYKLIMFTLSGILINAIALNIGFQLKLSKEKGIRFLISIVLTALFIVLGYFAFQRFALPIGVSTYFFNMVVPGLVVGVFYMSYTLLTKTDDVLKSRKEKRVPKLKDTPFRFEIENTTKNVIHSDPYDSFLVIAGANSGKTKSIGRQITREYIKHHFAGFIYDLKDFDNTRVVSYLLEHVVKDYPYNFYYLNFVDVSRSYRVNLVKPSILNQDQFAQLIDDISSSYGGKDAKQDSWREGALGILQGIAIRFYYDFPEYCTLAHIMNFVIHNSKQRVASFMDARAESRTYAKTYIEAIKDSPKEASGYYSGALTVAKVIASNKKVCYVLSGDDFDYNLIDPKDPKLLCVSNNFGVQNIISPIIASMIQMSARRFTLDNKVNFAYILDEATTFRVKDFEQMPSILREYKVSFTFITQAVTKIDLNYSVEERRSLMSNLGNQYIGATKDTVSKDEFAKKFGKVEIIKKSQSIGSSSRGGGSRSVNSSLVEENKYDPSFFETLGPGEFVGTAANSNYLDFHLQFNQYLIPDDYQIPVVREVSNETIERNYQNIIKKVQNLV